MKQVLLGANGSIGIELAKELRWFSEDITLVSRNPQKINASDKLLAADLTVKQKVEQAISGADIVYVTIGFPYKIAAWRQYWIPFMQRVVNSCIENKAKLVFFDNVYAIGGDGVKHITEHSPISPTSRKGAIRAELDNFILEKIKSGKLKAIIARSPDFFGGTLKGNSVLMNLVYDQLKKGKKAMWLCSGDKIHTHGYVPDLAKGTALLGNTESAFDQIWNLPADSNKLTGKDWIHLFAKEMNCEPRYNILPNWLLKSAGIFVPLMRELAEMNYQYDRDYFFDSSKFNEYFNFLPTPNEVAVKVVVNQNS